MHIATLSAVSDADAGDAIGTVLADPDQAMAESAVVRYLDAKAPTLHADRYQPWSERVASVLRDHKFARRRLEEWTLLRSIAADGAWSTTELADASDWLQRKVVDQAAAPRALAFLAEHGRTRRVRTAAQARLHQ